MIYMLMRRKVDDTDLDEVYTEETAPFEPYPPPTTPLPITPPSAAGSPVMVDAPSLRTDKAPPPANPAGDSASPSPPTTPPASG
jgi:hypothetical protein